MTLEHLQEEIARLRARIESLEKRRDLLTPPFPPPLRGAPLMPFSTCQVEDFLHPRFLEICGLLKEPFAWHRKLWEYVFVVHFLLESGAVKQGSRGLVFGVGTERLPALFAGMGATILATDAPGDIQNIDEWKRTGEHIGDLSKIRYTDIVDGGIFDANVSYRVCDMNNIPSDFSGFDFNWSSCCFEHLGSLEAGMQFVINAVEKTLRPGGVAVHTTEFNLSSDDDTVAEGGTVIYRRRDINELVRRLEARGHRVRPFLVAPLAHYWDYHVDVPPYTHRPHMKLLLGKYIVTSVGIVVQRGRSAVFPRRWPQGSLFRRLFKGACR